VPVVVLGTAGKGRVLFVNGSGTWRWDFRMWGVGKSNEIYERFWSNTVRWLVARGGFRNVTVKTENMTYNRGETVVFRGLVMDESLRPVEDARVELTLTAGEGGDERFLLEPDPSEAGAYRRVVGILAPGEYRYQASVTRRGAPLGEDDGEFGVGDFSAEFLDIERNDALLRSIAEGSGGALLDAADLPDWSGDLSLPSRTRWIREEKELWNHLLLFLVIVGLLSAEWFLRKRRGLS